MLFVLVQGGWGGWPPGNGKKLCSCQAQLGQAQCSNSAYDIKMGQCIMIYACDGYTNVHRGKQNSNMWPNLILYF